MGCRARLCPVGGRCTFGWISCCAPLWAHRLDGVASLDETEQERGGAAHHESGHAVAARKRGREVYEIFVHPSDGHTTFQETVGEDFAFIVYGGPWAQARFLSATETPEGVGLPSPSCVSEMFAFNRSDWLALEAVTGGDVDAVRTYLDLTEKAALDKFFGGAGDDGVCDLPRGRELQRPALALNPTWGGEMDAAWPEVQDLAARLLRRDREICVGPGEPLVLIGTLDGYDFWRKRGWVPSDDASRLKR